MKKILTLILIILAGIIGYSISNYKVYTDAEGKYHLYSKQELLTAETKHCNAVIEGLHWYYRNDTTLWNKTFKNTKEYKNIEIANNGDWEDFYSPNWQ